MAKFMYLLRGGDGRMAELSPEEVQAHMGRWGAYMQGLAQSGNMTDGLPLKMEGKVVGNRGGSSQMGHLPKGRKSLEVI